MSVQKERPLNRTVLAFGGVSLLNDLSSEMLYPLLPLFLRGLGASAVFIGLIEGIAETTASLLKLVSGWVADRTGKHRALAFWGYALAGLTRPLMALSVAPSQVLALRFLDRVGKGIRTAPRDALIASAVPAQHRGLAFGFHRAMDNLGATLGPLAASALLWFAPDNYRLVFLVAGVPALLSLGVFQWGVRGISPPPPRGAQTENPPAPLSEQSAPLRSQQEGMRGLLRTRYGWFLLCVGVFTLGNSSEAFLMMRAQDAGIAVTLVPLLWAGLNLTRTALAVLCGALADRWGRKRMLVLGWLTYAFTYAGFGLASSAWHIVGLFLLYAVYFGLTEASERALVADFAPAEARGQAYGMFHFVVGVGMLPASLLFGALWEWVGAQGAFFTAAGLALTAGVLLAVRK